MIIRKGKERGGFEVLGFFVEEKEIIGEWVVFESFLEGFSRVILYIELGFGVFCKNKG